MNPTKPILNPPKLVTRPAQLDHMLQCLLAEPLVAVDTESDSLYVYYEKVCLVQFSTPGQDFLVDPLAELDLSPLGWLFADPGIEKIFHAAEYDLLCLKRDYGFEFKGLFDTMWAARVLGWPHVGLAAILAERFGVKLDKRWQRYNWGKRPLDRAALSYARLDTHYLLDVRNIQLSKLCAAGCEEEAREIFDQVTCVTPAPRTGDPASFWRVKGVWDLTGREQAIVRELYAYRDDEASQRNRPVFRVLSDQTLLALAQARPRRLEELQAIAGMTTWQIKQYGRGILKALARGCQADIPRPPHTPRPDERVLNRYEALRAWRNTVARQRGVEPDVIMANATLMSIAQRRPATLDELEGIEGLGSWRRKTYGAQLLHILRDT
jgi:ribonuclease D